MADSLITGLVTCSREGNVMDSVIFTHALFSCMNEGESISPAAIANHRELFSQLSVLGEHAPGELIAAVKRFRYGDNG